MHVLLPPSEGKNAGGRGRSITARAPHPVLGAQRARALQALQTLLEGPTEAVAKALLLPPGVVNDAIAANARAATGPTMPALQRYAGVVYDGLGFAALSPDGQRAAARSVYVFSGLFGVVRGDEAIPDYRVPAKAVLPELGVAGTAWRPVLDEALPGLFGKGLLIDLRSSDYAAMWRPRGALADKTITVRVLSPLPDGGLGVVSYPSKFAKGRLVGALAEAAASGHRFKTAADVAELWTASTGHAATVTGPGALTIHHPAKIVGNPDA